MRYFFVSIGLLVVFGGCARQKMTAEQQKRYNEFCSTNLETMKICINEERRQQDREDRARAMFFRGLSNDLRDQQQRSDTYYNNLKQDMMIKKRKSSRCRTQVIGDQMYTDCQEN